MRYLGVDFGRKKVGLALSDEAGTMGFPHSVVGNDTRLVEHVLALVAKENVGALVIGESKNYSGEDNAIAGPAREFAKEIAERAGIQLFMEPEMLTTQEARRFPDGVRMPGSPDVDSSAAALILTNYLSKQA